MGTTTLVLSTATATRFTDLWRHPRRQFSSTTALSAQRLRSTTSPMSILARGCAPPTVSTRTRIRARIIGMRRTRPGVVDAPTCAMASILDMVMAMASSTPVAVPGMVYTSGTIILLIISVICTICILNRISSISNISMSPIPIARSLRTTRGVQRARVRPRAASLLACRTTGAAP